MSKMFGPGVLPQLLARADEMIRGFNSPVHRNLRASEGVKNLLRRTEAEGFSGSRIE